MRDDAWGYLYETEAFIRAQRIVAAGIGGHPNHGLLDEIQELTDWVLTGNPDTQSKRLVYACSAFALLATKSVVTFAATIEAAKLGEDIAPDDEDVRNTTLYLLEQWANELRAELD